jgi:two-component system sensor histidine kinase KdpD
VRTTGSGVQWLLAVLAAAVATGVCVLLDRSMSVAGLAMAYLVGVVACALTLGRGPGILCSLLSVSALNYFFVPPRYSFEVDGAEYWWTLAVLLGLSLALNALIASLRERRSRAELGEARAARLHGLGEALADCKGHEAMARVAAQWLHQALGRPCAVFLLADDGGGEPRCWGEPGGEAAFHSRSALWAIEQGRMLGRGCDDWPDLPLWCAPLARHGSAGALQVLLAPGDRPAPGELQHWQALTRQVGLSVERERAAARAQEAQDSARAEAARNTLLASLSHDLRTPLAGIVGSASALRTLGDAMPARERGQLLENLENEARDLTLMADNILQMARLSQPQSQLRTQWESAEEILAAAVVRLRRRWDGARIQLRVTPGLPPVQAEAGLLVQVVANLVDNAVRHAGVQSPIVIQAGRSRAGIFIAVRDEGPGLPDGDPVRLFERYGPGGGQQPGAAGLGLAICRLIVQAHGGEIAARRCEPGTEFRLDLPAATAGTTPHDE